jgi:hypothetical protein
MYNYRHKHAIAAQGIAHKSRNPLKMLCILFAFLKSGKKSQGTGVKMGLEMPTLMRRLSTKRGLPRITCKECRLLFYDGNIVCQSVY